MARVCMVAFTDYLADSRVRREAEALADRGDVVDVVCLRQEGERTVDSLNGVKLVQLPVTRYRGSSALSYLSKYFLFFLLASWSLALRHLKRPYQVIQIHTMPDFMVFVAAIPKFLGAKVILDVHDLMPELFRSKFALGKNHWLIRFLTWMERRSISFAHKAICVHKPHLDRLVSNGNPRDRFLVLLNLPDPRLFSRRAQTGSGNDRCFRLLYHGALAKRHGLSIALHAIASLRKEIKDLRFQIVGDGDDLQHLIDLASELGLAGCVCFSKGIWPIEKLVPVILDADIGIVPILDDDFTRYMLPTKLLEYVALGKPVICSRTQTIEAYFDDTMVLFFEPGNPVQLAEKILMLYRNPDKREQLKVNADRFNREYNWEWQKRLYYQLIDNL